MEGERWLCTDTSQVRDMLRKGLPRTCCDGLGNPEKQAWTPDLKGHFPDPSRPCWCWPPLPQHICMAPEKLCPWIFPEMPCNLANPQQVWEPQGPLCAVCIRICGFRLVGNDFPSWQLGARGQPDLHEAQPQK